MLLLFKPLPLNFKYSVERLLQRALFSKLALISKLNLLWDFLVEVLSDLLSPTHTDGSIVLLHFF